MLKFTLRLTERQSAMISHRPIECILEVLGEDQESESIRWQTGIEGHAATFVTISHEHAERLWSRYVDGRQIIDLQDASKIEVEAVHLMLQESCNGSTYYAAETGWGQKSESATGAVVNATCKKIAEFTGLCIEPVLY